MQTVSLADNKGEITMSVYLEKEENIPKYLLLSILPSMQSVNKSI